MIQRLEDIPAQQSIQFILDGRLISVSDIDPATTVLQYLREQLRRTGTKEGCAEGDCGACTVVIGELKDNRVRLRSVNACIQFLPMLHGKALFTVESLKSSAASALHPVQQSMVNCHGSQCGFCTAGFIMSLFALFKSSANPDRQQINDALSGNLCRCTGYRPIIDAALDMYQQSASGERSFISMPATTTVQLPDDDEQRLIEQLRALQTDKLLHLANRQKQFFSPVSISQLSLLQQEFPDATLVAGNTDVGLWVNKQLRELSAVIYLGNIRALHLIKQDAMKINVGAAVALTDAFEALVKFYPSLTDLFRRFASMPVRNAGTLVGNIANGSPIGDSMPVLIALQSELILNKAGSQRTLAMEEFYQGYQQKDLQAGEFVESVNIPLNENNYKVASYKVSKRYDQDISAVCGAFVLGLDEGGQVVHIRIAFGGMAAIPARATQTEQMLLHKQWNQQTVEEAMSMLGRDFSPLSDMRASAAYRLKVAENLMLRFYLETTVSPTQDSSPVQLYGLSEVTA